MKRNSGFTLIELMIVVAIIAIIAAIAIPNLLRSRMSANEAGATGATRTISTGEVGYQAAGIDSLTNGIGQYATITALGTGTTPFIDSALASGSKQGYAFQATPSLDNGVPRYTATATPAAVGKTGIKAFFVDESGVIRFTGNGTAPASTSPPVN
ncbi:MAG: prepilin-type N-terminal cleavage/methylation domain-containing protein [Candidatus Hydrogenedentes bacterium]|nr:prepilin-type N-terminal cleavage/methylation domain-containing protein [Candidatus Hydrogenedentota bacterium]